MSRRRARQWAGHSVEALRRRWGGRPVYAYGRVDSTNAAARELAEAGKPQGTVVVAREQSSGRGRGERAWLSPPGGLYLSMIFRPRGMVVSPLTSVLAALGIVQALDGAFAELRPRLKWPNDIVAAGRKLGGVLPEATSGEAEVRHLVVGVGINVKPIGARAPADVGRRATSLAERLDRRVELVEVADAVVAGLERYLDRPSATADAATLEALDRYDWLKGRRVRVGPEGSWDRTPGLGVGIAPDGALLFRPDRGALRRLSSGSAEVETE